MPQLHTVYLSEEPHRRFLARCQAFPERSTSEHLDEVVTAGLDALDANDKSSNGAPTPKKSKSGGRK